MLNGVIHALCRYHTTSNAKSKVVIRCGVNLIHEYIYDIKQR